MTGYRLSGFLVIFLTFVGMILFVPDSVQRDYGWWIIGAFAFASLWWMAKSGLREWRERERIEADRKARRERDARRP